MFGVGAVWRSASYVGSEEVSIRCCLTLQASLEGPPSGNEGKNEKKEEEPPKPGDQHGAHENVEVDPDEPSQVCHT